MNVWGHITCVNYILDIWFDENEDDEEENKEIVAGKSNGPL